MRGRAPFCPAACALAGLLLLTFPPSGTAGEDAAARHREAVAALAELGAAVTAQTTAAGERLLVISTDGSWQGGSAGLAPLRDLVGPVKLRFGGPISEEALAHLAEVPGLVALDLHLPGLNDAGLAHLAGLHHLERLNLTYTAVTDAGLQHLVGLKNLKWLGVIYTAVTAEGAGRLQQALPQVVIQGSFAPAGEAGGSEALQLLEPAPFARYKYEWGEPGAGKGAFRSPAGISVFTGSGGRKLLLIADAGNDRIRHYTADGMFIDKWGESGSGAGQFRQPLGVAAASASEMWVTDSGNHRLQKTRISTRTLMDVPGEPMGTYGGPGSAPGQLDSPSGLAIDAAGNLYIVDSGNGRIQKWSAEGSFLSGWGSLGNGPGQFAAPAGIALGPGGDLFVADASHHRVLRFDPEGRFLAAWGGPGELSGPRGIAVDGEGNVYVADTGNDRIRKFGPAGQNLGSIGGPPSGQGRLSKPYGVAVDADGDLYVTDSGNGRIVVFTQSPNPGLAPQN